MYLLVGLYFYLFFFWVFGKFIHKYKFQLQVGVLFRQYYEVYHPLDTTISLQWSIKGEI